MEVGRDGPRAFATVVGHALELVPVNDPALLRAGDTLVVRLLYHGRPVAAAHLHAGAAPAGITATSDSAQVAGAVAPRDIVVETGPDGVEIRLAAGRHRDLVSSACLRDRLAMVVTLDPRVRAAAAGRIPSG